MSCTAASRSSGTSTSPPRAKRSGQYVKRSVGSCGPAISPGRTSSVRSGPNAATAARSHKRLSGPYVAGTITSRSASGGSSGVGLDSSSAGSVVS